ncbi:hypothetical protein LSTR_LSTR005184 [Laodelphax striatellus]|uniref:F5/8 type C domain-containing protein n=1 Tax=Laodelphax striatellus TaxID=195883 RepID=A0A482XMH9_LAOST|nr:hypothetical protein LSTR_LSTR005184 [Laodelphax striatellus]
MFAQCPLLRIFNSPPQKHKSRIICCSHKQHLMLLFGDNARVTRTMRPSGQSRILFLLACLRLEVNTVYFGSCSSPLGLESGGVPDKDISASSAYDAASVGPQHGRLRHDKNGGAWCPRHMVTRDAVEFLEVNLGAVHAVTGTQTQGRFGNGQGQEYAEEFLIDYWRPGLVKWRRWRGRDGKQILPGNTNTYLVEEQKLDPVLLASKVRFVPYSVHVRTVCMRVEILGCPWKGGLISYSMPQGLVRGDVDLRDVLYDGREEGGRLVGGLGQLVDGHKGSDNFHVEVYGPGKGVGWVGWRNDTPALAGQPVDIVFEFDRVRNFSAISLHTNNLSSKEVQVFSQAKVYFSVNSGRQFSGEPVQFSYMPDLVMEHARNVTVKLHHRIGRYLKLQLYFASRWLLLSEVSFDSVVVHGNVTEEEVDNSLLPGLHQPDDAGTVAYQPKEDTPQRDEFHHTTPTRDQQRKTVVKNRKQKSGSTHSGLPGHFGPEKSVTINMKELQMRVNVNAKGGHHVYGQVSMEEPPLAEKAGAGAGGGGMYHEPFSNMYS